MGTPLLKLITFSHFRLTVESRKSYGAGAFLLAGSELIELKKF